MFVPLQTHVPLTHFPTLPPHGHWTAVLGWRKVRCEMLGFFCFIIIIVVVGGGGGGGFGHYG